MQSKIIECKPRKHTVLKEKCALICVCKTHIDRDIRFNRADIDWDLANANPNSDAATREGDDDK
jgi:hypothetical protein